MIIEYLKLTHFNSILFSIILTYSNNINNKNIFYNYRGMLENMLLFIYYIYTCSIHISILYTYNTIIVIHV